MTKQHYHCRAVVPPRFVDPPEHQGSAPDVDALDAEVAAAAAGPQAGPVAPSLPTQPAAAMNVANAIARV